MASLGAIPTQKQALLQAYCGVFLPGYPNLHDAGLTDKDGYFRVAGGRVRMMQCQALQKAQRALKTGDLDVNDLEAAADDGTNQVSEPTGEETAEIYARFLITIARETGSFLVDTSSRPSNIK